MAVAEHRTVSNVATIKESKKDEPARKVTLKNNSSNGKDK